MSINESSMWVETWANIKVGGKNILDYLQALYSCTERENMASRLIKNSLLSLLNVPP